VTEPAPHRPPAAPAAAPASQQAVTALTRGSLWMIAARWAMRLIGLVSTMILARLLAPEDFGLIALALLAYGLLETLSYAGVDLALMRQGNDSREHYDTAWTIQVLQGVFIAVCLAVAAPFVAAYFDEPRAKAVIWWIALRAPIESLQNIGVVAFRKELDFAKEFRFTLISKLLGFVAVVGAALLLRNYWALVVGSIFAAVLNVWLSYRMHPYRPRWSLARFGEIWSFSQWLVISRVGSYLNRKCDEFVVGGHAGTAAMGSYHVAQEIATLPSNEIVMPVRRAMFPSLARISGQPDEYARAVLSSFSGVAAICLFVSFTLALVAPDFVAVVLGSKWPDAAPLMRWLALFGGFSALVLVLEVPLWVAGRTQLSAVQSWLELAVLVPAALWAVQQHGAEGVAAARAGVALAMLPMMMMLIARAKLIRLGALLGALWRPAAAAFGMAGLVLLLPAPPFDAPLLRLLTAGTACTLAYPALLLALWWLAGRPAGFESSVLAQVRAAWQRRATPAV
jgi:lipopolysaccharide exporter